MSRAEGVEALIDYVNEHALTVDYLVNNAGFGDYGQFVERDMSAYSEMIRLNVESMTTLTHYFAGVMVRNGHGRILNVASTAGFQPDPHFAVYGATKAYVINFTEALHHELRHTGVTATVLSPGATRTAFADRADMLSARLFDGSVLSASQVAEVGFQGMMKRKLHVVPGLKNRLMALLSGVTPTSRLRLAVAARIMEPKRS